VCGITSLEDALVASYSGADTVLVGEAAMRRPEFVAEISAIG
jgi:indole-3-glycerol phosphate synthase